jgi:heterodisulfide reductase subunit C
MRDSGSMTDGLLLEEPLSRTNLCYQCKKCSSGCPVIVEMDLLPHQVIKLLQLGGAPAVLESRTVWICASCQVCTTRCPNDIDIAGVMDRMSSIAASVGAVSDKNIALFHRVFLGQIKRTGRIHELSMLGRYKLASGKLFGDLVLGAKLLLKGKLKLLPVRIRGRKVLRRLFDGGGPEK